MSTTTKYIEFFLILAISFCSTRLLKAESSSSLPFQFPRAGYKLDYDFGDDQSFCAPLNNFSYDTPDYSCKDIYPYQEFSYFQQEPTLARSLSSTPSAAYDMYQHIRTIRMRRDRPLTRREERIAESIRQELNQQREYEEQQEKERIFRRNLKDYTKKISPTLPTPIKHCLKKDNRFVDNYRELVETNFSSNQHYLTEKAKKWKALLDCRGDDLRPHEYKCYSRRLEALDQLKQNNVAWESHNYTISPEIDHVLQHYGIDQRLYTQCVGNTLQHVLHQEILETLDGFSQLDTRKYTDPLLYRLSDTAVYSAELGRFCNSVGCMEQGFDSSDFAWSIVDFLGTYGYAIKDGFSAECSRFFSSFFHPIDTARDLIHATYEVSKLLGKLVYKRIYWKYLSYTNRELLLEECIRTYEDALMVIEAVESHIKSTPPPELVKNATAFLTSWFIPGASIKVVKSLLKASRGVDCLALAKRFRTLTQAAKARVIIQNPGTVLLANAFETLEELVEIGKDTAKRACGAVCNTKHLIKLKALEHILLNNEEIEKLACMYNNVLEGFAQINFKSIIINSAHILGPEIRCVKKGLELSGFHHDFMGFIQKAGIILFDCIKEEAHGIYSANWYYNGIKKQSTFFPKAWDRAKVIEKIIEAYKNQEFRELTSQGKWRVRGMTNEGIKIEIIINKLGEMTSAYPIISLRKL